MIDFPRYSAGQIEVIKSEAVAAEAAKALGDGATATRVQSAISVGAPGESETVRISARDGDRVWARDAANAVAKAYIENRRKFAVANLDESAAQIEVKLQGLQTQIAQLDAKIAALPFTPGATATLTPPATVAPTPPPAAAAPTPPESSAAPTPPTDESLPTTDEGLKAARYAAAQQYESLYGRQQDLLVESSLKRGEAELLNLAETPGAPVSPKPKRDAALGGVLGLLLGLGIAMLRDLLDDRVRDRDDVARACGLRVLAELPFDDAMAKAATTKAAKGKAAMANTLAPSITMLDRPHEHFAESMRGLRSTIQFLGVDKPIKRLAITSPVGGDGKSSVAANLAVAFARSGLRTVLISADLRKPTVAKLFGMPNENGGLTNFLATDHGVVGDESSMDYLRLTANYLRPTDVSGLYLFLAGTIPPNPAELLGSKRMAVLIDQLPHLFDIAIFDCPPVLAVSDPLVLASRVDGVVLVAAAGDTKSGALGRAADLIETTGRTALGVVLNKVSERSSSYYYDSSYRDYLSGENNAIDLHEISLGDATSPRACRKSAV